MKKIIVIGAGISGISASMKLAKAGFKLDVFETKNTPGGRVYSFTEHQTGELIDNGQHAISGAYTSLFDILNEFGTSVYLKKQKSLNVTFSEPGKEIIGLDTGKLFGMMGIIYGFITLRGISPLSKYQLMLFILKLKLKKISAGDLTCMELFRIHDQSDEIIKRFWEPLILATLNNTSNKAPAKLLINILNLAFFAGPEFSRLILPTKDLSVLINPFTDWLKSRNGDVHYCSRVESILFEGGSTKGIRLSDGREFYADYVISTIPPNSLFRILDTDLQEQLSFLKQFDFSTIVNIYYWLDKYIDTPNFVSMLGTISQWMFNRSKFTFRNDKIKELYPGLINITISSADYPDITSQELAGHCWKELQSCLPQFKDVNILRSKVIIDRFATFSSTPESEKIRPPNETRFKNFFIAGDWTDTGLPATIEGAARSGESAAEKIISDSIS